MKNQYCRVLFASLLMFAGLFSSLLQSAEIEQTKIEEAVLGMNVSGNKEAPTLLYIIPWKDISESSTPPQVYRLMDEVYSTVDPGVFEKEVAFFDQLSQTSIIKSGKTKKDK